jgi:hypothetical protein
MSDERRKLRFVDWALLLGLFGNLLMVGTLLVKWGVWQGTIQTKIENICSQLQEYASLPGRVSYLEGYVSRDSKTKK